MKVFLVLFLVVNGVGLVDDALVEVRAGISKRW